MSGATGWPTETGAVAVATPAPAPAAGRRTDNVVLWNRVSAVPWRQCTDTVLDRPPTPPPPPLPPEGVRGTRWLVFQLINSKQAMGITQTPVCLTWGAISVPVLYYPNAAAADDPLEVHAEPGEHKEATGWAYQKESHKPFTKEHLLIGETQLN